MTPSPDLGNLCLNLPSRGVRLVKDSQRHKEFCDLIDQEAHDLSSMYDLTNDTERVRRILGDYIKFLKVFLENNGSVLSGESVRLMTTEQVTGVRLVAESIRVPFRSL